MDTLRSVAHDPYVLSGVSRRHYYIIAEKMISRETLTGGGVLVQLQEDNQHNT
jgi:hypothetical protein